jgi:hypothetical protein
MRVILTGQQRKEGLPGPVWLLPFAAAISDEIDA